MFTVFSNTRNANLYLIIALAVILVAILSLAVAPSIAAPKAAVIPVTGIAESSDYYQRHPELRVPGAGGVDMAGDFYLRHKEWTVSLQAAAIPVTGVTDPVVLKELAQVRQATAKYHDVNVALADGFIRTPACVESPDGGMGIHFINPARLMDPTENILEPEILLYIETEDGMKLLGVEYFYGIGAPDTPVPNPAPPAPILFGRSFDGPMEQHEPGQPPHYDLHVWIWKANPSGMFAMWNPNVSCQ